MSRLNLVYEWIGPTGPLTNKRIPTIYDFANSSHDCSVQAPFIKDYVSPLYYNLSRFLSKGNHNVINLLTPCQLIKETKFLYELELIPGTPDFNSYFVMGSGILERIRIADSVLEGVKDGNGYIAITSIYESFLEDGMLDSMHKYFTLHNIPLNKIIYITNCFNGTEVYEQYCETYNITTKMNMEYLGVWMRSIHIQSWSSILPLIEYKVELKKKMFLQFNRRFRSQRIIFLLNLCKRNLLKDFYISFSDIQPGSNTKFIDVAIMYNNNLNLGFSQEELQDISSKLPLILDTCDFSKFPMESSLSDVEKFYSDSLIHIIAETNFYTNIIHITEKTLKPIMYKQPFIFVGPPNSITCLKSFGFKSFSELWDESYDQELDHDKRMNMILDLLEQLNNLSDEEKLKISEKCSAIVKYNFKILQNKTWNELYRLVDKYGQ